MDLWEGLAEKESINQKDEQTISEHEEIMQAFDKAYENLKKWARESLMDNPKRSIFQLNEECCVKRIRIDIYKAFYEKDRKLPPNIKGVLLKDFITNGCLPPAGMIAFPI